MTLYSHAPAISWRFLIACTDGLDHAIQDFAGGLRFGGRVVKQDESHWRRFPGDIQERRRPCSKTRTRLFWSDILIFALLIGGHPSNVFPQQAAGASASDRGLPDAPGRGPSDGSSEVPPPQRTPSTISGTVLDTNGDAIQGARLRLTTQTGESERILRSGSNGEFIFSELPPGTFKLTVSAEGMGTVVTPEIPILPGDMRLLSQVILPVAAAVTSVRVSADREELAEEQVHLALDQRVLGIIPNFYSSYDWNAPPMGSKQKFELAFRAVTDPVSFMGAGVLAGIEQGNNSFPGYGQGVQGYAKRYGAAYSDDFIGRMMGSAVLPSLFHQDPRYFYKGSGSVSSRALYAIGGVVFCRGDNGRRQINFSHLMGSFAAGGISNLYYPSGSRGVSLTIVNGLIETAGNAGNNLLREFVMRRLTPKVPDYANGKP
jgi:hypothetical protein